MNSDKNDQPRRGRPRLEGPLSEVSADSRWRLKERSKDLAKQRWSHLLDDGITSFLGMVVDFYVAHGQDPQLVLRTPWVPVERVMQWAGIDVRPFEFFECMKENAWLDFNFSGRNLMVKLRATRRPGTREYKDALDALYSEIKKERDRTQRRKVRTAEEILNAPAQEVSHAA